MSTHYRSESKQADEKQKVTLYLSPELHRDLKIRAAVEMEPMSVMAEKALSFYLDHPEVVEGVFGSSYQVHQCPECSHPFVLRDGEVHSLPSQAGHMAVMEESEAEFAQSSWVSPTSSSDSSKCDELVPC
jgi:hypothetical protein